MAEIKFDHTSLDTPAFIVRMREISAALTGNAVFTALSTKLAPFDTLVDTLETKNNTASAAAQLVKKTMTEVEKARGDVESAIRALAKSSEGETADAAALQSGGWHLVEPPAPVGPMPAPQNLTATGGDLEGEVDMQWEPTTGRDAYLGEWAADPNGPWTQFYVGTKSSCTASGLNPGQMYYFRVRAVGPLGPGPWSDLAQKRAS